MSGKEETYKKQASGAWIVHHGQKVTVDVHGPAEFPALDTAAKAASLLSQLAASDETTLEKRRVEALAKAARLNSKTELPALLEILKGRRLIDSSASGDVTILGLTSRATLQHANDIFLELEPTKEEHASIALAELSSKAPTPFAAAQEFIGDQYQMTKQSAQDFLQRSEAIGFIDAEGQEKDKLLFNGNLFRRDNVTKVKRVLDSLSSADHAKAVSVEDLLAKHGCVGIAEAERILGGSLFEKLKAAGMYDVNHVVNPAGEFGFVTRPAAFHKYTDPLVDDAFDLAKALVAALTYGMTQSGAGRGRITMIHALLNKLISGQSVGPATAIGEDYKVLEHKGVIRVTQEGNRFRMQLLKKDIGEIALSVLTTGEAVSVVVLDRPLPGQMTGYSGPERNRSDFRKNQSAPSRRHTQDVLNALRTKGGL